MSNSVSINDADTLPPPAPSLRGYAWLKANRPERFREICQAGGRAVAAKGNGHRWNSAEAHSCVAIVAMLIADAEAQR